MGWRLPPVLSLLACAVACVPMAQAKHANPRPIPRHRAAPDPAQQLLRTEQARDASLEAERQAGAAARVAQAQEARLATLQVGAAAHLHQTESRAADAVTRIDALQQKQADLAARLAEHGRAMAPMVPVAMRLSRYPSETVLAASADPQQAVRGLLVLRGLTRRLDQEAAILRTGQTEAAQLASAVSAELTTLRAAQAEQARQSLDLDKQIAESRAVRRAAEDSGTEATRRAAAEAARADTLRGVLAQVEADQRRQANERQRREALLRDQQQREALSRDQQQREALSRDQQREDARADTQVRPTPPPPPSATLASSPKPAAHVEPAAASFSTPVAGQVVRVWGERGDAGPSSGMAFRAPPAARVVAPCPGKVVFSGPFRSFGPMVILDCGAGYHIVLAGLDRLDAQVGQPLQAGQPLGVMPGWDPRNTGARPSLYLELRRGGQAVNPAPYLRGRF